MKRLIPDDVAKKVLKAYADGMKLSDIEKNFELPRATIYWLLDRDGKTSRRAKRNVHLKADEQTVAHLYDLILEQEQYISELEKENQELRAKRTR